MATVVNRQKMADEWMAEYCDENSRGSLDRLQEICGQQTHGDEFARINLEKYQSDYGQFVADLLSDQGSVLSLERLGSTAEQCAWVASLRNSGVFINPGQSTFVYPYTASWGGRERLPVFVGSRQERDLSMMSFESWYNRHPFGRDVE